MNTSKIYLTLHVKQLSLKTNRRLEKKKDSYNQDSKEDMKAFGSILGAPRSSGTTVLYVSAWKEFSKKQNDRQEMIY